MNDPTRRDWKTAGRGDFESTDGWTARYVRTDRRGFAIYKVFDRRSNLVATGGIRGLDGKTIV